MTNLSNIQARADVPLLLNEMDRACHQNNEQAFHYYRGLIATALQYVDGTPAPALPEEHGCIRCSTLPTCRPFTPETGLCDLCTGDLRTKRARLGARACKDIFCAEEAMGSTGFCLGHSVDPKSLNHVRPDIREFMQTRGDYDDIQNIFASNGGESISATPTSEVRVSDPKPRRKIRRRGKLVWSHE